jgi:hypothetical protein
MSEWKERVVYTPVPAPSAGRNEADDGVAPDGGTIASDPSAAVIGADVEDAADCRPTSDATALVRAENEDDDGYDPYSDWHDQGSAGSLFEPDPWN